MNQEEIDNVYYELKEISAILWVLSNLNEEVNENIMIVATHYYDRIEEILKRLEKHL